jgi:hypothetical protein
MKSLCPGASMIVYSYLLVSNFHREQSIVIPLSLSYLSLSRIKAYLKEPLFIEADIFAKDSRVLASMPPHLKIKWPVVVDLPESTCPITTKLI